MSKTKILGIRAFARLIGKYHKQVYRDIKAGKIKTKPYTKIMIGIPESEAKKYEKT